MIERRGWVFFLLGFLTLAFFIGALVPGKTRIAIEDWLDLPFSVSPVAHFLFFSGASFLIRFCYPRVGPWQVLLAMLVLGSLIEIIQLWIPGRETDLADLSLDMLGASLGILLSFFANRASPVRAS
ncbi:hypothetical protein GCM10027040_22110 [Halomonas shantousis]